MKLINLSHNLQTKVDDSDYVNLMKFDWFAYRISGTSKTGKVHLYGYKPGRKEKDPTTGKYKKIWIYNFIMNPPEGMFVDHINGDPLDNTRANLRIVTHKENCRNRGKRSYGKTSKYLGVCRKSDKKGFQANICCDNRNYYLGSFNTEIEAAKAYNIAAIKYFGDFARLNIIS